MNRIGILNTKIDNLSMSETLIVVSEAIEKQRQIHHVVINAGKIVALQKDQQLRESVNSSDLINADGQAVVWAARFLGKPIKERVAGIDLMQNLVALAHEKNYRIFLLGAKDEVVEKVAKTYSSTYNSSIIAGFRNGYFRKEQELAIAETIAESGADMLFVAMSSPKKENFLYRYKNVLQNINFIMGVGGSFDVVAGKVKRAPIWMQKSGLEWFYRFLQEPRRMWKRYFFGNVKFMVLVLKERFKI